MHFHPFFENSISTWLFYGFCAVVFVQLLFLVLVFARFIFYKKREKPAFEGGVSVVICCRNEEENLLSNLQSIVEQDYPNFEVIVVNHMSSDDSCYVLEAFQQHYKHLRVVNVNRSSHLSYGKKFPLSIGIKAAKNEYLLLTDADCMPTSNQWLKKMVSNFSEDQKEIVLGYGPMNKTKGFLNRFIRFENTYIAMTYFSFALAKIPYMSVGRNFGYSRELFIQNKGFKSHYSVISGDDDLFLQEVGTRKNVSIELDEQSWTYSDGKDSWNGWFKQKQRHYTASPHYSFIKKMLLGSYSFTWLVAVLLFVILLFDIEYRGLSVVIFGSLILIKWLVFLLGFNKLKAAALALLLPVWETLYMLLTPFVFFTSNKSNSQRWN